jgi:hypothetical protein
MHMVTVKNKFQIVIPQHVREQVHLEQGLEDAWLGRVTRDWRFYFAIENEEYVILSIMAHPK